MIVSISGMDNSGKTTQCEILKTMYPDVFSKILHIKNTNIFNIKKCNEEWWFNPNNKEEFTRTIFSALQERIKIAQNCKNSIVLFDKGTDFYDARVVATLIMKGMSFNSALIYMLKIKKEYIQQNYESLKLFLSSSSTVNNKQILNESDLRYNAYIELNKLILEKMPIDYTYISSNSKQIVTFSILNCIQDYLEKKGEKDKYFAKK